MKTIYFALVFSMALHFTSCNESKTPVALQKEILTETGKLEYSIANLRESVAQSQSPKVIAKEFKAARLQYRKVEWALEYLMPQLLNPSDELALGEIRVQDIYFRPHNFENLDSIVASGKIAENKQVLLNEINTLLDNSKNISAYLETIELGNEAVSGIE